LRSAALEAADTTHAGKPLTLVDLLKLNEQKKKQQQDD
jgi:hypothetical protein